MHEVQRGKKRGIWQQCWFLEFSQKGFLSFHKKVFRVFRPWLSKEFCRWYSSNGGATVGKGKIRKPRFCRFSDNLWRISAKDSNERMGEKRDLATWFSCSTNMWAWKALILIKEEFRKSRFCCNFAMVFAMFCSPPDSWKGECKWWKWEKEGSGGTWFSHCSTYESLKS